MTQKKLIQINPADLATGSTRLNLVFKESGFTQAAFAEAAGISQAQFNKMLKGKQDISLNVIRYICRLGYAPAWIINGKGKHKEKADENSKLLTDVKELTTQITIQQERLENMEYFIKNLLKVEFIPAHKDTKYYKKLA